MRTLVNRSRDVFWSGLTVSLALLSGCHHKTRSSKAVPHARPRPPLAVPVGTQEEGLASWYGVPYHGRPAADGEIYDMEKLVAAHRTMPFNTWLKVTNLSNGLTVNVRVIDRGPFVEGRIVDLSKAAARQIQMLGPGTARVRLDVIAAPVDSVPNDFYGVQVGAFASYPNAEKLRVRLASRFGSAQIVIKQGNTALYRVLVGKEPSPTAAQQIADGLVQEFGHVFVVRLDAQPVTPLPSPPSGSTSGTDVATPPEPGTNSPATPQ